MRSQIARSRALTAARMHARIHELILRMRAFCWKLATQTGFSEISVLHDSGRVLQRSVHADLIGYSESEATRLETHARVRVRARERGKVAKEVR